MNSNDQFADVRRNLITEFFLRPPSKTMVFQEDQIPNPVNTSVEFGHFDWGLDHHQ